MARDQWSIGDLSQVTEYGSLHDKVMIARCDECASRVNEDTVGGFFNFDCTIFVEAIRESTREHFGHVLDDDYAGAVGGHGLKKFAKSFSASNGGAHSNDFVLGGAGCCKRPKCRHNIGGVPRQSVQIEIEVAAPFVMPRCERSVLTAVRGYALFQAPNRQRLKVREFDTDLI